MQLGYVLDSVSFMEQGSFVKIKRWIMNKIYLNNISRFIRFAQESTGKIVEFANKNKGKIFCYTAIGGIQCYLGGGVGALLVSTTLKVTGPIIIKGVELLPNKVKEYVKPAANKMIKVYSVCQMILNPLGVIASGVALRAYETFTPKELKSEEVKSLLAFVLERICWDMPVQVELRNLIFSIPENLLKTIGVEATPFTMMPDTNDGVNYKFYENVRCVLGKNTHVCNAEVSINLKINWLFNQDFNIINEAELLINSEVEFLEGLFSNLSLDQIKSINGNIGEGFGVGGTYYNTIKYISNKEFVYISAVDYPISYIVNMQCTQLTK